MAVFFGAVDSLLSGSVPLCSPRSVTAELCIQQALLVSCAAPALLLPQLKDETERAKEESAEQRQNAKRQKEHEKQWESSRDTRVGTWRDFMKKGGTKGGTHIKPPKQKTWDEEKTYVQRPVGEQHRPPPPKPAGPKK